MDIVLIALQALIMSYDSNLETKEKALAEYVKRSLPIPGASPLIGSTPDFHMYRLHHGRIATIKAVRERIGCGLMEALIIVKGIEAHYNIAD